MTGLRWCLLAAVGVAAGAVTWWFWSALDAARTGCTDGWCELATVAIGWFLVPGFVALLGWLLVGVVNLVAGYGNGFGPSVVVAMLGAATGYLGVRLFDAYLYGTPRPPLAVLALCGAGGFLLGAAAISGSRRLCIGAVAVAGVLLMATVVGEVTSPSRDRIHRFTQLRSALHMPDQSRYRVVSAEGYLRYHAVQLNLTTADGGPMLELFELPVPRTWNPPTACGPSAVPLALRMPDVDPVADTDCTAYPGGGWQRVYPDGQVELLDVRGGALVVVKPIGPDARVPAATLRDVLTSLRPTTPEQLAKVPAP
jgi:hypothetical protein